MATSPFIPIAEYLRTAYCPDCDYVDGKVQKRPVGEKPHSSLQGFLYAYFLLRVDTWNVRPYTEQRVQVSATRFRIPDVCVERLPASPDSIIRTPPLLCIEILSPEDTPARLARRLDDYRQMGVENIWVLDPVRRLAWTVNAADLELLTGDAFEIAGTDIRVPLAEINILLDRVAAGR